MVIWIIFIISLVAAVFIVNSAQQLYMKVIGANGMFFNGKTKLIAIFVVALLLAAFVINIFGIEIPKT